ncbi:MAG: hypothetical protein NW200_05005 [Hyphomonadaceae bacterium]|nr:hypothetical protein [Hyphomonadaceae bacterium]
MTSEPTPLEARARTAKLGPWQSRRGVLRWARLIEREAASTGEAPLQVMRTHLSALDQKAGVAGGLAGFVGAIVAFVTPAVMAETEQTLAIALLGFPVVAAVLAASYAVESLGFAADRDDADIEIARLVRLAQRAANHAVSVRCLQVAAGALGLLAGLYFGVLTPV